MWRFWFGCSVSLLCLWLAFRKVQLGELLRAVAEGNPLFLVFAVVAQLFAITTRAQRWVVLLKERTRPADSFWVQSVGFLFTNVFPFRLGEPTRVLLMAKRCQLPTAQVAASAIGERLLDVASNVLLLLTVLPWMQVPSFVRQAALSFCVLGLAGISMLLLSVRFKFRCERILLTICSRLSFLSAENVVGHWRGLVHGFLPLTHRRTVLRAAGWSLVTWAFTILVYWSVLQTFQPDSRLVEAAFMVVALSFAVAVPSSPGFVGVFQLVGQQALTLPFGAKYDATGALAITLTAHLTYYIPTTVLGVVGLWRLGGSFMTLGRGLTRGRSNRKVRLEEPAS